MQAFTDTLLKPFSHDPPKKPDSLRQILRAGIVYLIIPRLTAFASFHTTQCNNSTDVRFKRRMYRYSWLPLNYRIFGLNHRKYQWNDYVSLACGARRVCVTMRERSFVAMLHQRSRTKGHHACAIRPLSHGTSVNKQRIVSHEGVNKVPSEKLR